MQINRIRLRNYIVCVTIVVSAWAPACRSPAQVSVPMSEEKASTEDATENGENTAANEETAMRPVPTVAFEHVIDHWLVFTGLPGPGIDVWRERMERVCSAAIWESEPLTSFTIEFLREDGRDLEDLSLVRQAADAIWLMARQPAVCPDRFPADAQFPPAVPNCGNVSAPSELCE